MYILDTDLFSLIDRSDSPASQRLRFRLSGLGNDELATTIVTFEEQTRGWLAWLAKAKSLAEQVERYRSLKRMPGSYRNVIVLDFDEKQPQSSSGCKNSVFALARWI
jgi:tRNA(fMet)-specific endonuclease VapC